MNRNELRCYYADCQKLFQNKVYLVTHINNQHLQVPAYVCGLCDTVLNSNSDYLIHYKSHKPKSKRVSCGLSLLDNFSIEKYCEYIPPSSTSLPVLPRVEEERARLAYKYKLPMSVKLYDSLCSRSHLGSK